MLELDRCWTCPAYVEAPEVQCDACQQADRQAIQRNHDAIVQSHTRIVLEDYERKWGERP